MMLAVSHLVAVLDRFPAYDAIGVFADDLAELRQPMRSMDGQGRSFLVTHQDRNFKLDLFPERGVARLAKTAALPATSGVSDVRTDNVVRQAIDVASKQKGSGLLSGTLFALLLGAMFGGAAADSRRVFALVFDTAAGEWRAYDGGLLRWMKGQLNIRAS